MITLTFTSLAVVLVVLQTTVLPLLPLGIDRFEPVYLLVAFAAYRCAWLPGVVVAFTAGWFLDVLAGTNLGVYPLVYLGLFCGLKLLTTNSPVKESAYRVPLVGLSYLLAQIALYFIFLMVQPGTSSYWSWAGLFKGVVLLVIAAHPVFLLLGRLHDHLEQRARNSRSTRRRIARKH